MLWLASSNNCWLAEAWWRCAEKISTSTKLCRGSAKDFATKSRENRFCCFSIGKYSVYDLFIGLLYGVVLECVFLFINIIIIIIITIIIIIIYSGNKSQRSAWLVVLGFFLLGFEFLQKTKKDFVHKCLVEAWKSTIQGTVTVFWSGFYFRGGCKSCEENSHRSSFWICFWSYLDKTQWRKGGDLTGK